jgi:peptide/nickel transport system ATP-binding protein
VPEAVLEVADLVKLFQVRRSRGLRVERRSVQAVSGVSFTVNAGETLGLVGESGSGKTTVGRCVLRLLEPTAGSIKFRGTELTHLDREGLRAIRKEMQIVFQDPYASLDPKRTVGAAIAEPFEIQDVKGDHDA